MSVRSSIAPKNSANSTSRTYKVRGGITDKANRLLGHFWALGANLSASNFLGAAHYFAIHHWEGEMTKPEADALVWVPCDELGTFDLDVDRIAMSEYLWGYEALRRQGTAPHEDAEPVHEALQPGDKVTWWKRMAGGDYVSPVQATVLALTEKRVKIEEDDDGAIVIRYVPPQSLQCQE